MKTGRTHPQLTNQPSTLHPPCPTCYTSNAISHQMRHKCVFWTNTEDELPGGMMSLDGLWHDVT
jgi:hypothetical protein